MKDNNTINLDFNSGKGKGLSVGIMIAVFIAIIIFSKAILIVSAGERAVIFNSFTGVEQRSLGEGFHLLIPGIQTPTVYNVRTQTYTMVSGDTKYDRYASEGLTCLTSDGQKIVMDMSVRFNLIPEKVWELHQRVGPGYEERIIIPEVRSVVRNTIAEQPVMAVYSEKRAEIQHEIQDKLEETLGKYDINLSEVLIRNVNFSEEFANAVEMKQVALQEAERMEYVLQKEEKEKERRIIEAEGEAKAITKKGEALRANPLLIQYNYVQKLSPNVKAVITDQASIMKFPEALLKENQ